MRTISFKTSYEDLITRIPGLFAYIEKNEINEAMNSPLGCYGKIVENINLVAELDEKDTDDIDEDIVDKLQFDKDYELVINDKLIIPNYKLVLNENELEKEKDKYKLNYENGEYILIDDTKSYKGNVYIKNYNYAFKTLINLYYKYRNYEIQDDVIIDNDGNVIKGFSKLKDFIEIGIGKVKVELSDYISQDNKDQQEIDEEDIKGKYVPEYIYLVEAQRLYNEIVDLHTICCLYTTHKDTKPTIDKETEINMCCKCQKFHDMGGLPMLKFLETQIKVCEQISKLFYKKTSDKNNGLRINYNVNLFSSDRDFGIVTPIENTDEIENDFDFKETQFNTNSKLKSVRKRQKYYNILDEEEKPEMMEDWLYFYRVGHISNITVLNDNLGNILTENTDNEDIEVGQDVNDLIAYGDVIENIILSKATQEKYGITYEEESNDDDFNNSLNTFKIIYWTDVHLKAKPIEITYDEDNNKLICYGKFEPDYWYIDSENNCHGIKYEEIFTFDDDSEIADLINDGKFRNYINGYYDFDREVTVATEGDNELKLFEKYSFSTYTNSRIQEKPILGKKVKFNDVITDATAKVLINKSEKEDITVIRNEFYEGISYTPTEELNVYIERGVTSVFDKHIRFGEIKTMQDMEEFTNGSFFKLQE